MRKIDDIDSEIGFNQMWEEFQLRFEKDQEKKWQRKQLKYWWLPNAIAIIAIIISITQFFYSMYQESQHKSEIDKINIELKQMNDNYNLNKN